MILLKDYLNIWLKTNQNSTPYQREEYLNRTGREFPFIPFDSPMRFRLSRKRGARSPEGGKGVARPSRFGNPFPVKEYGVARSIELFGIHLSENPQLVGNAIKELRGRPLGCYCKLEQPCHANYLISISNSTQYALDVFGFALLDIQPPTRPEVSVSDNYPKSFATIPSMHLHFQRCKDQTFLTLDESGVIRWAATSTTP